jgi:hypothetical protein
MVTHEFKYAGAQNVWNVHQQLGLSFDGSRSAIDKNSMSSSSDIRESPAAPNM